MNRSHSTMKAVDQTVSMVLGEYRQATKYLCQNFTVKATRQQKPRINERSVTIILTVGAPNYAERKFIKQAKKAAEPFPIRRVLLKLWPRKR